MQTFFSISRDLAQDVLKERDVMDINLRIAIVYASQERVNVSVAEDGFDLVLVMTVMRNARLTPGMASA